jgi:hypothetical protein
MKKIKILAASLTIFSLNAFAQDINYEKLEEMAHKIACKIDCVESKINVVKQGPFIVDGITLPSDALRDVEQQQSVVSIGMYINVDGDVLIFNKSQISTYKEKFINKLLPIKIFPAAIIADNEKTSPIIIGINK